MSQSLRIQIGHIARRSILRTLRQPAQIIPAISFPLFLLAVNSGGLDAATKLPGFPTDSYLTFALAIAFMQGALFTATMAGTEFASDIETGFLNRLALTPLRGPALLSGLLAGVTLLGLIQGAVYLGVGLLVGAHLEAGFLGGLAILGLSVLTALGFGALGAYGGIRTGNGEAVQGLFPIMFVLLFLSSMSLPRNLIEQGWFRTIATWNPVSYVIEAFRSLLIEGWNAEALAYGVAVALAMTVLFLALATSALRTRLVRT